MRSPTDRASDGHHEFDDSLTLLRRVLLLERQRGCADDAVLGGLGRFLTTWLSRQSVATRSRAESLIESLSNYASRTVSDRQAMVDAVLRRLDDFDARGGDSIDPSSTRTTRTTPKNGTSVGAASHGDRSTANPSRTVGSESGPSNEFESPRRERPASAGSRSQASANSSTAGSERKGIRKGLVAQATVTAGTTDDQLAAPVTILRGVGSANAERLRRLGVETVRDLLYHFPRYHLDYRAAKLIRDLAFEGFETILATVWQVKVERKPGGLLIIRVTLADETGTAEAIWIRRRDYFSQELTTGRTIVVSGECRIIGGRPVFRDPEWEHYSGEDTVHTGRLVPVYPLVEGLNGRFMRRIVKQAVDRYASLLPDYLPTWMRSDYHLIDLPQAIAQAHYPDSDELKGLGQKRLAFDELLVVQVGVLSRRREWEGGDPSPAFDRGGEQVSAFLDSLPFRLTAAQERALTAIRERISTPRPMSLLLEGDVGSGKTVVAAAAMVQAAANGYQSALMAPTEVLAEQHFQTLTKLLTRLGDDAPRVTLLTGSIKGAERRVRYAAIKNCEVEVVVGTQALVQGGVDFGRLGFVVIDEQHRFGVNQRSVLRQKGYNPHVLVMTATPIPRTLALTLYGDLDLSIIDELPPGRQAIKTRHLRPTDRPKAYEFLRREVQLGHQAFVICPLVEESDRSEARAAIAEYERLKDEVFPDLRLGLLHGRMKPAEKDSVMRQFQRHELDVLVSTAVVEVGIDVPNATVMLIEGANRFGLAQLHQFRGRVGRGDAQSYCLLIADTPNEASNQRLDIMERTRDGFALAEEDLRLRGPGEFFGTRQSGLPDFKMARWGDAVVLEQARHAADRLLGEDPSLTAPEHRLLRQIVAQFWSQADLT